MALVRSSIRSLATDTDIGGPAGQRDRGDDRAEAAAARARPVSELARPGGKRRDRGRDWRDRAATGAATSATGPRPGPELATTGWQPPRPEHEIVGKKGAKRPLWDVWGRV